MPEMQLVTLLEWQAEERLELIKGRIFKMSPATKRIHQKASVFILNQLFNFLHGKQCDVYNAPFDVHLPRNSKEDKEIVTVLQPDICVVYGQSKLDDKGCLSAPDIVVEILSPGNNRKELQNKYEVYEESGVKEYWIIHPDEKTFMKYTLDDDGHYQPSRLLTFGDIVTTPVLPGFTMVLDDVFNLD
ncbi:Uma2 family endonuclease [Niabella hibiscisoli]|uniref:Uma2 family endonuclease n=1 Tax=Niabella hibiscisoli TaxID=1825928 RepID=UPI001F0EF4D6|nr:Uma2 family endonuclease [Niabella hibiscisoli]MCH5717610.1 Uma2 family endonuclease [Niabella hibiscisoli]